MQNIYKDLLHTLEGESQAVILTMLADSISKQLVLKSALDTASQVDSPAALSFQECRPLLLKEEENTIIAEPFFKEERLLIFGGGHVAYILSEIAAKIGFSVVVTEDRPEFGNKERFPWASNVYCEQFDRVINSMTITVSDYIVLLTRGHFYDKMCLKALYKQERSSYLGILASRRRMRELTEQLSEDGIEEEWMSQIHSPVGLDIGAVTPEEIAIAILAQIIQTKRLSADSKQRIIRSDIDMRVIRHLANPPENRRTVKKAIFTILENHGITPRKAGAKMIVYEDGVLVGTVGGGPAEGNLIMEAPNFLNSNIPYRICYSDIGGLLTDDQTQVSNDYLKILIERD